MKFTKQNQNGGTLTCVVHDYRSFVDSCNFTIKGISHSSEVEIQDKILFFWGRYVVIALAEIFIHGKTFIPVSEVWGFVSLPSLEHIEISKKERMAKQGVGDDLAHF